MLILRVISWSALSTKFDILVAEVDFVTVFEGVVVELANDTPAIKGDTLAAVKARQTISKTVLELLFFIFFITLITLDDRLIIEAFIAACTRKRCQPSVGSGITFGK